MATHVAIGFAGRNLQLEVDTSRPFSELDAQVRIALKSEVETGSAAACDAVVDLQDEPASWSQAAPRYRFKTSDKHTVSATHFLAHEQAGVARGLEALACLLEDAADRPYEATGRLRLIRDEDALPLYADLNRTETMVMEGTVLDLVTSAASSHGTKPALVFADRAISYEDLEMRSDVLARRLLMYGADQEHPVALCVDRSETVPLLQLAAMKAGSFFVPLDPSHPQQRLIAMTEECRPALVIASEATAAAFRAAGIAARTVGELESEAVDALEMPHVAPSDLAYMIYTSGTTGRPKGVMVTHGSLLNLLLGMRSLMDETRHVLAVASFAFDISVLDIFLPLIHGATMVIAPDGATGDPWQLMNLMEQHNIDFLQATPVTWRMLLAAGFAGRPDMRMLSGGEALPRDLASGLLRTGGELWNGYGPTETTIYSSFVRVQATGAVTIGTPMANTRFYVVDEAGHLLPPGFAGELYIGGSGVAAGYFEQPVLQAERFLPDRWATQQESTGRTESVLQPRLFRTGDLVRWLPASENAFQIFGRLDQQVKLRGYRIEPGEIEAVLREVEGIADAAVVLREDEPGEPWLVGYCSPKPGAAVDTGALMKAAAERLPRYMLPSRLVMLQKLPLTGSGKVDRKALAAFPAPDAKPAAIAPIPADPIDSVEATLLRIFRDVLKSKTFGVDDDFFQYGGYSMQAIRLLAMINHTLQQRLPLTVLFDAPTVRKLAALIHEGKVLEVLVPIRPEGEKAPFFLVQSYLLYELSRNVVEEGRPVYGLREAGGSKGLPGLQEQVAAYVAAIQKQYPSGPVHLGGWCAAAPLTVEIARRLAAAGRIIGMVALFDAEAPGFVERPAKGSALLAKVGAMWRFHRMRLREMGWRKKRRYVQQRLAQAPAVLLGRFYERYMGGLVRLQKRVPWLPGSLFRNRFNAGDLMQVEQVQPLDLRIQLFRARDVPIIPGSDEGLGWHSIARGGVDVKFIAGHHESMFLAPNVTSLRAGFRASMQDVETRLSGEASPAGVAANQ